MVDMTVWSCPQDVFEGRRGEAPGRRGLLARPHPIDRRSRHTIIPPICAMLYPCLRSVFISPLGRDVNAYYFRHAKAFYLLEVRRIDVHQAKEYLGHSNIQQTLEYSHSGVEEQKAAFKNGNGGPAPAPKAEPAPSPAPSGKLDAAVAALTAAYSRGELSADAFAAAVAAISSGPV